MRVNANLIKRLRTEKSWTQQHLADSCEISLRTVQRVERYGTASNETLMALSSVFELAQNDIQEPEIVAQVIARQSVQVKNKTYLSSHLAFSMLIGFVVGVVVTFFIK